MKAIINGKRYDTDKATLIGEASSTYSRSDFHYWSEELYRTPRSGAYFIYGEGGALSRYAVPIGSNGSGGGERIIPLTEDEAFEWAENNLRPAEVEEQFADRIEDA